MEHLVELIILCLFLTLLVTIGIYTRKKITSPQGFFLADRSLSWFPLAATITATTVGGSATIVAGGRIYAAGLPALWYDLAGAIGLIVLGLFLTRKIRKTGLVTLPDIIGSLYDEKVRYIAAILIVITEIAWVALLIQSSSLILSVLLPVNYMLILLVISILFIGYTFIGGQYAVVYTDIIQFFIMIVGICFLATPLLVLEASPFLSQLPASSLSFPTNENIGLISVASIFAMMFFPHIVGPDIYAKVLSAKNKKSARKGTILSGLFKLLFAVCIAVIGLVAIVLPGVQEQITNPYQAIPLAVSTLSPVLAGIVLAAFLSVMMSSADSCLLSAGTILSVDITKKNNILTSRIGIIIIGGAALLLAFYYSILGSILDTLQLAYTVFTAGVTLPVIFGFYKKKTGVTNTGALYSIVLGGTVSILWLNVGPQSEYAVLIGLAASVIPLLVFRNGKQTRGNPSPIEDT